MSFYLWLVQMLVPSQCIKYLHRQFKEPFQVPVADAERLQLPGSTSPHGHVLARFGRRQSQQRRIARLLHFRVLVAIAAAAAIAITR